MGLTLTIKALDESTWDAFAALVERNKRREDVNAYEDPVGHCEFYDIGRLHPFAQRSMHTTDGNIAIAKLMNLSISCDHRVVDGWDAASFVQAVKRLLETPALLFVD